MNIIDEYIKLIRKDILPDERENIYRRLNENKDTTEIKKIQRALFLDSMQKLETDEANATQSLNKFHKQRNTIYLKLFIRKSVSYAALFLLAFMLGALFIYESNNQKADYKFTEIFAPQGQRLRLVLEDSSVVWLNSNTKLLYASDFGEKERRVKLIGEAYFEVKKNISIPFIVQSAQEEIRVLGTEFNVSAYSGEQAITTLIKGKVELSSQAGKIIMNPNEVAWQKNGEWIKEPFLKPDALLWKDGIYVFDNSTVSDLASKLSKYYDVRIVFRNPASGNLRFSGKFRQRDGIDEVFKILQRAINLRYSYNRDMNIIEIY